jgi:hypothetical protein
LNHDRCEVLGVDRRGAKARQDKGDAADVVEVTVRDDDSFDAIGVFLQVFCVGEDIVNFNYFGL